MPDSTGTTRYRERLTVPIVWWVLSGLFALSLLLAFGLYLGPVWGIAALLVSFAVTTAVFAAAAIEISVDERGLRVGRAFIEHHYLGDVVALDAAAARRRRGPEADARAYLVLRPYIPTAVQVSVTDTDDPTPYWLVTTRRPRALVTALTGVAPTQPSTGTATNR